MLFSFFIYCIQFRTSCSSILLCLFNIWLLSICPILLLFILFIHLLCLWSLGLIVWFQANSVSLESTREKMYIMARFRYEITIICIIQWRSEGFGVVQKADLHVCSSFRPRLAFVPTDNWVRAHAFHNIMTFAHTKSLYIAAFLCQQIQEHFT